MSLPVILKNWVGEEQMRIWALLVLTFIGFAAVIFTTRYSWLRKQTASSVKTPTFSEYRDTPEFKAKFSAIISIMRNVKNPPRPFSQHEMEMLRKALNDPIPHIRHIAVAAFTEATPDPRQREELIHLAISRLRDPYWLVRDEAVYVLGRLQAKEAIPYILPLLNDPDPRVRETAQKTLQRLGYKAK